MSIPNRYLFYFLIFTSSIFYAIISGIDATVNALYIPNPLVLGFSIFFIGIIISFIFSLILSISIKEKSLGNRYLDPSFSRLRLIHKKEIKYHIFAGIGNAFYTLGYFALFSILDDPSVVLPFTQIVILYLVIIESFTEKNTPTLIEIQAACMVTIGALLGSISLSGAIDILSIAIVFIVLNPSWALFTIYQRKLKRMRIDQNYNDSINIRFWNVIFSFLIIIICLFIYDLFVSENIIEQGITVSFSYFGWISLIAGGMFLVYIMYIRALGIGKASVAQAVRSTIIIFSIPVSLFLSFFSIIPSLSTDPSLLIIKISGLILIVLGIISFALTQTKAYIFISIKPNYSIKKTMQQLWNIRGVTRASAINGHFDIIMKIQTRTLIKGYERILKRIEHIKGIQHYRWESVLKDWDKRY